VSASTKPHPDVYRARPHTDTPIRPHANTPHSGLSMDKLFGSSAFGLLKIGGGLLEIT
jgi:hypothetical protein